MSTNIINENDIVNQKVEKEFDYFSLNKKVFNELILISRPKNVLFQIMVHLSCKSTYKNGLVGVHSEISKTAIAKELCINKGHITDYLKQLVELQFIKIFNVSPLVLQVLEIPKAPVLNDIKALLLYIHINPHEFNFHRNLERKTAFFDTFKEYDNQILIERIKSAEVPLNHPSNQTDDEIEDIFGFNE
jgi:hypothetical protein